MKLRECLKPGIKFTIAESNGITYYNGSNYIFFPKGYLFQLCTAAGKEMSHGAYHLFDPDTYEIYILPELWLNIEVKIIV